MNEKGYAAWIVTGGDPHMSEYVAARWRTREFFSGFTGSAGILVVTAEKAGLWTDFRYWIQAAKELDGSGVDLFKAGHPGTIPFIDWIASELNPGEKAACEASTVSLTQAREWSDRLKTRGIALIDGGDIPEALWSDRPAYPSTELYALPLSLAGVDRKEKIDEVRLLLEKKDCGGTFLSSLDDIAWLLNIRAMDVTMNPVALAYCWISRDETILFTEKSRMADGTQKELTDDRITIRPYSDYDGFLRKLKKGRVYLSEERNSWRIGNSLPPEVERVDGTDLTAVLKSKKNSVEIDCFHKAMVEDGIAMVNFLSWIKKAVRENSLSEVDVAVRLREFRADQPGFIEESFSPISAYGPNGALCHYDPLKEVPASLGADGLFLIDSGGQYEGATTDITRTISLGNPTDDQRRDYTLVLKGHIRLSRAVFPEGTRGFQLDTLARQDLWSHLMNYGHGTGHGVGAFLNVHEGPHSISHRLLDFPVLEGTVTSNEPGLYREGRYGIRIENLIHAVKAGESEFGAFLKFETLTLCPYERELIDATILDEEEKLWVNDYHRKVFKVLSGLVNKEGEIWLRNVCSPL